MLTTTNGFSSTKGVVIIVHGLQSNTNSSLVREMAQSHIQNGYDVAAINFRGCSGTPNNSLKAYHLGFTNDLHQLVNILSNRLSLSSKQQQQSSIIHQQQHPYSSLESLWVRMLY